MCSGEFYRHTGLRATLPLTEIHCAAVTPTARSSAVQQSRSSAVATDGRPIPQLGRSVLLAGRFRCLASGLQPLLNQITDQLLDRDVVAHCCHLQPLVQRRIQI